MNDRAFDVSPIPAHYSSLDDYADTPTEESFSLHLETGDYFTYVAALLGFVEETLDEIAAHSELAQLELRAIRALRSDLRYLDKHYQVTPRLEPDSGTLWK